MTGTSDQPAYPIILAERVGVAYGDQPALREISLAVAEGERVLLRGPNGAGKSTLIRVLAGLQRPERGTVSVAGGWPSDRGVRRVIGVVVHGAWLDPDLTVTETLHYFGRIYGLSDLEEREAILLAKLEMLDRRNQRVGQLSRGYQQRLTLARALLHEPKILLLDEPDTGLDEGALALLSGTLRSSAAPTVVLTSHNRDFGLGLADRVLTIDRGRIVEDALVRV